MPTKEAQLLIVDHDKHYTDFLAAVASENGCHSTVINQSSHFPIRYHNNIDLITMEVFMPVIDGIELLQFLARQKCQAQIILISACGPELLRSTKAFAENLGLSIKATLDKPYNIAEFNQILKHFCQA